MILYLILLFIATTMNDIYYPVKPFIREFNSVIYLISLTTVLIFTYLSKDNKIDRYHPRKNQRNKLLVTKEALIREHNFKPLLTGHKESIDW